MGSVWSRRRASLVFPFPLQHSAAHFRSLPHPHRSFASCKITSIPVITSIHHNCVTITNTTSSISVAAATPKGPSNSPPMFSHSQPKTAPPSLKHTQTSISSAFSPKPPPRYTSGLKSSYGPPLSSVLNKNAPCGQRPRPQEKVIQAFRSPSSFTDSGISVSSSHVTSHTESQTQMSALHAAVYFDESDFEDDGDLNFDDSVVDEPSFVGSASPDSYPIPNPLLPRVSPPLDESRSSTPGKRCHDSTSNRDHTKTAPSGVVPPTSSAPFPWSSSPVEHLGLPASKAPTGVISLCDEPEEAPKSKKRKMPWAKKPERAGSSSMPTKALNAASRVRQAPALPKELKQQYPWDMTASDLKKASNATRKRSDQKRGMSTVPGLQNSVGGGLKQKKLTLSVEQMQVLDLVLNSGKSVFFTGSAGTGKSVLMREVIASLNLKFEKTPESLAVTASTGLAACNIGGITLHSFAGIGLGKESVPDLVKKIKRNPKAKIRWLRTKVLIIDEISMVDGELFDKLEAIARTMRNNGRAFGGIQLVVTGDFFQLPPVPDSGKLSKFAFDADTWNTAIEHIIGLTQVFRQRDPEFAAILNEMRVGRLSEESIRVFQHLRRPLDFDDGIEATELFPTRQEVDAANNNKMRVLSGEAKKFMAEDTGTLMDKNHRDKLLANCMAPAVIELKENSQVMLIKNMDDTLVNGSLGRVVGFMDEKTYDIVQEDPQAYAAFLDAKDVGETSASRKLAALARATGRGSTTAKLWPLVEFALSDGTSRQYLVQPEQWKVELPSGEVQACRTQIPLILAWALSIHKAQGQTLERVKVDLGKVFEKGQAYVALSRATCQEGLQVLRFDAEKVMAHNKVRAFYNSLYSAEEAKKKATKIEEYHDEGEKMMGTVGG